MELLTALATVLMTLVGYSTGVVLAGRHKNLVPGLLDLVLVVVLWVAVLPLRQGVGEGFTVMTGLLIGGAAGATTAALRSSRPAHRYVQPEVVTRDPGGRAAGWWQHWKEFAVRMGNFQSRMMMGFFYFGVVTPFALLSKLSRDPLARRPSGGSFWLECPPSSSRLERAKNQF
jgi:hypothetical protein